MLIKYISTNDEIKKFQMQNNKEIKAFSSLVSDDKKDLLSDLEKTINRIIYSLLCLSVIDENRVAIIDNSIVPTVFIFIIF
jgi:hypothetical protein